MKTENKYPIRKLSAGTTSILVGSLLFISPQTSADEVIAEEYDNFEEVSQTEVVLEKSGEVIGQETIDIKTADEDSVIENELTNKEQESETEEIMAEETPDVTTEELLVSQNDVTSEDDNEIYGVSEDNIELTDQDNRDKEISESSTEHEQEKEAGPDENSEQLRSNEDENQVQPTTAEVYEEPVNEEKKKLENSEETADSTMTDAHEEPVNEQELIEYTESTENTFAEDVSSVSEKKIIEEISEEDSVNSVGKIEGQKDFIVNDDSFEISEEYGLNSGTYTFLFNSTVDSESMINIHNSEGVLVDSFNISGNIDDRDAKIKLVLNDNDKVDIVGAETVVERIDNIYGENTLFEYEMTVPHGYHEISNDSNIKPGVYMLSHPNRNGDFSIGVMDPVSGEFIPRNEDRGNVGRQWALPVNFYDGETILIENINHFHIQRMIHSEVEIRDTDQEVNPEGSFIPQGYYTVVTVK